MMPVDPFDKFALDVSLYGVINLWMGLILYWMKHLVQWAVS